MSRIARDRVNAPLSVLLLGDVVLDEPNPDHWLSGIAPALRAADVVVAHLEVPHTRAGEALSGDVPAPGADPANLAALARVGVDAVSLAGNHMADSGPAGIADTLSELDRVGIAHAGAGMTLAAARTPAVLPTPDGRRIALLSYNCVGPEAGWATDTRAGVAPLPIATRDAGPVSPTAPLTAMTAAGEAMLRADVAAARADADLVLVALHKGLVHIPARLAAYERPVAHAAIEAGADVVVGHHAHIVRGIEFHRGHPIFHGLGNGCVVTGALAPGQDHPGRAAWAERRKTLFGFEPDPAYTLAPFHPEAVHAMLGRLLWHPDGRIEAGFLPVHVEAPGRPVLAEGARADAVAAYIEAVTREAGLPALSMRWNDAMAMVA